jgi:phage terminase large subunit-like protein
MDGSRTFDTTVVAWASRAEDGRVDVDARVFSVRAGTPHHVLHEGGKINFEDVEEFVLDRFDLYHVQEAAYDPRYLDRSAELIDARLPDAAIVRVEPQSQAMRAALTALERGVAEGIIRHRGDPVIAEHVDWAGVQRGESDEVRRVFKIDRSRPIDALVAIALAYSRASALQPFSGNPVWDWEAFLERHQ